LDALGVALGLAARAAFAEHARELDVACAELRGERRALELTEARVDVLEAGGGPARSVFALPEGVEEGLAHASGLGEAHHLHADDDEAPDPHEREDEHDEL